MKKIKLILLTAIIPFVGLFSQGIDKKKMDRDIEVAENIIKTLMEQQSEVQIWGKEISGTYVEGFGVIFSIPKSNFFSFSGISVVDKKGNAIASFDDDEEKSKEDLEAERKTREEQTIEAMKTFLIDYADLIGQLKPSDKILITQRNENSSFFILKALKESGVKSYGLGEDNPGGISVEIKKSDLIDYKQGKISRESALDKINIKKDEKTGEKLPDLELFSSIMERLYKPDLSETFNMTGPAFYEKLQGFGVIYKMTFYISNLGDVVRVFGSDDKIRAENYSELQQRREEEQRKAEELYPKFIEDIKQNIIEYGRTVKSLDDNEVLMLKIKLTRCSGCNMPESVDLAVKYSVISSYDKGTIDQQDALNQITVKEHSKN